MISFNKAINIKHSWGWMLFIGIVCCLVLEPYRSLASHPSHPYWWEWVANCAHKLRVWAGGKLSRPPRYLWPLRRSQKFQWLRFQRLYIQHRDYCLVSSPVKAVWEWQKRKSWISREWCLTHNKSCLRLFYLAR